MSNEFDNVQVHTSQSLASKDSQEVEQRQPSRVEMAPFAQSADQARQIAEVQVMMTVAKGAPRQEVDVWEGMQRSCHRMGFAQSAKYAFRRGGTIISGLGIKAIRELTAIYGNIDYGYRELERQGDFTPVEAFAWDMERNVRVVRKFQVKHWRDKRGGGELVEAERDKYELIAGQAQRRVRSCLEQLLPADYLEEAESIIDKTLQTGDGRPVADRVRDMEVAFRGIGVTKEQLETYLQHPLGAIVPAELPRLAEIFASLRDGIMHSSEVFPVNPLATKPPEMENATDSTPQQPAEKKESVNEPKKGTTAKKVAKKGRPKKKKEEPVEEPSSPPVDEMPEEFPPTEEPPTPELPPDGDDDIPFGNPATEDPGPDLFTRPGPGLDPDGEVDPFA